MPIGPGTRVGPYEVTALIGEGGMGKVWRARHTALKRDDALKVLPDDFIADPERLARFQREAQVLASLNHPNIAHVYGLEQADGAQAMVMELVEGPTLADRIAGGAIPIHEALPIARQIAEALDAAHAQGIIHRDLKPANIKVRPDGTVKVLDFGLARFEETTGTSGGGASSQSPTITSPAAMTRVGVLLGTAAYMSPEQARGKMVDKRSDIWAFGCVLYEMLTGRRAFAGDEVADTLAKVLEAQPNWLALEAAVPFLVHQLLHRCLEKDARRRLRDIGDAFADLQDVVTTSVESRAAGSITKPRVRWWRVSAAGLTILSLGLAAGGFAVWRITRQRDVGLLRFDIAAPDIETGLGASIGGTLAISPRGREIVFGGVGVHVRPLDQLEVRSLAGPNSQQPFISPDGVWVAFLDGTTLKKVRVTGGPVLTIAPAGGTALEGASWGIDDTIVFTTNNASGLLRVSANGGEVRPLTSVSGPEGEVEHRWPEMLPSGRAALFTIFRGDSGVGGSQIAVLDLTTGKRHVVVPHGGQARYVSTGHLVYGIDSALWAVPFDARRLVANGSPVQVLADVRTTQSGGAEFAVAPDGSLVYISGGASVERRRLTWVDRQGREHMIPAPIRAYAHARVSADGQRLALDVRDQGEDIWVWDLRSETLTRVTLDPGFDRQPIWAPDSRRIAFYSNRGGTNSLLMVTADGTGVVERLVERPASAAYPTSFSPDGKQLLLWEATVDRGIDLKIFDFEHPQRGVAPLLSTQVDERNAEVSPNGRWIAYQSNESGQYEVYVRPFPSLETGRTLVSSGGGTRPMWAPDGRELFYYADAAQRLIAVPVTTSGGTFTRGPARVLFEEAPLVPLLSRTFDISPDGQRFLLIKEAVAVGTASAARRIVFVQNWLEELKRLVPTN